MRNGTLSQTRLRSWWAAVIWGVAGLVFAIGFFAEGGPATYADDRFRIVVGAAAIAGAYGAYLLALWATGARGDSAATDERDAQVVARASRATLVIVLVGVFALSVGLWEAYRSEGSVPVGWLWFLAYGTVIATFVVHSLATLIVDARTGGHG